jgi:hypothetical protein
VTTLDLRALMGTLNDHSVRYVVIGGVAVGAHGYVRATADLDIVPDPAADNASRLAIALHALEATLPLSGDRPFDPAADGAPLRERRNVTADTRSGALDIVQDVPGVPAFDQLDSEAVASDLLGVPVRVCSLAHLRRMK